MHEFEAIIEEGRGGGAVVHVPFDVKEVFGSGRPPVAVTFDGAPYRGTIASMGGRYLLGIRKDIREAIGKGPGDAVRVSLQLDAAPRTVEVPCDLALALEQAGLREAFDRLSYTHRREHVEAIGKARKPETRARRIAGTLDRLR